MEAAGEDGDVYRFSRRMLERVAVFGTDCADREMQKVLALLRRFAAESARDAVRDMNLAPGLAVAA